MNISVQVECMTKPVIRLGKLSPNANASQSVLLPLALVVSQLDLQQYWNNRGRCRHAVICSRLQPDPHLCMYLPCTFTREAGRLHEQPDTNTEGVERVTHLS
jgi:hypothetical protein